MSTPEPEPKMEAPRLKCRRCGGVNDLKYINVNTGFALCAKCGEELSQGKNPGQPDKTPGQGKPYIR